LKTKEPFTKREAWIDILLEVNHSQQKVNLGNEIIVCECGESLNSLDTWGERWRWTKSKVRRFFKLLEDDNMIVTKSERITTRLTVCNYGKYQVERNTNETQTKHKRNANETQATPNKKYKNEKEVQDKYSQRDSLIINCWNNETAGLAKCHGITKEISSVINGVIADKYKVEDIVRSIKTYNHILNGEKYFFSYKWNLHDFIKQSNACRRFAGVDDDKPFLDNRKSSTLDDETPF